MAAGDPRNPPHHARGGTGGSSTPHKRGGLGSASPQGVLPGLERKTPELPSERSASLAAPFMCSEQPNGSGGGSACASSSASPPAADIPSPPAERREAVKRGAQALAEGDPEGATFTASRRGATWVDLNNPSGQDDALPISFGHSNCARPVQLLGTSYDTETGEVQSGADRIFYTACGDRRHARCPACSKQYQRDAWHVIQSGMSALDSPAMFITLTAPGMARPGKSCLHHIAGACKCGHHHAPNDSRIGAPFDGDRFDYERAAKWNATSSKLWEDFMRRWRRARRNALRAAGVEPDEATRQAALSYVRVNEHHQRGLLHMHVVVKGAHSQKLIRACIEDARATVDEVEYRFGSYVPKEAVKLLPAGDVEARRKVANYFAKYLVKGLAHEPASNGARGRHIQRLRSDAHRLARGQRPTCAHSKKDPTGPACPCPLCREERRFRRRSAEQLGHHGHVFSKSSAHGRKWGKTLGECREARHAYRSAQDEPGTVGIAWQYISQGYGKSAEEQRQQRLAALINDSGERPPPGECPSPVTV